MENYKYIYKHRRGTAEQWKNSEIIPEEAELIVELDEKNYKHKLKLGDGIHTYENLSYLTAGGEVVTQTLARTVSVTLYASAWEEVICESDPNIGYYKQTLNIDGIAANSKVDLQPTADMIAIFQSKNLAFVTETVIENNVPTIICYSIGSTPSSDYTLQATVTEVEIDGNNIIGNTVSTIPNLDNYATKSFVEEEVEKLEPLITTTDRWSPSGIATALSEGRRVVLTKNDSSWGKLVFDNFVYLEEDNVVAAYILSDQPDSVDMYVYSIYGYISSDEWLVVQRAYPTKTSQLCNDSGFITAEELESENYYYTTVSGAIADIEAGTTEHAIANADEAYVKVFTSCDGTKTVMLLKDLLETAQISTTKNLNINLGGHTLTIDSSVAYIPFNSEMVCVSNGNIVIDITNGVQYASLITFWGNHVIMDNINLKVFGGTSQLIAGVYVTNNNGVYDIKNCKITVSNSLESAVAIYNNQGTLNIENTVIKTDTDSAKNSIGITNKSRLTIVDSTIFADAPDNSTDRNGLSIGIHNYGILYSTNTDVCGTHSGMQTEGNVCIYGGTYTSCSHGGLYLVANGKGKTLVKDATIACSDYTGIHDASAFSNSKLAALYLGSSSNSNGEIAYFDGCTIDATGADHVMVLRESNGDNLNVFNISNSTISDGENYIRMDGATVKLNIGVGTNITTDRLPSGANYEYTNEFYRKFGKDADIKGRDINLVLATCATKNELDKIPNQVINTLETNAIEQIPAKNLFNKNNYKALKAYVNSTGKILTSASEATTVYIPVEANQTYTVSKIASKRFAVGITDSETMANGTTFTETIQTNTATSITISTGANSKNLAVFCHVSSADTLTVEEILDTLQIEKGDTATEYEEWHEPIYNAVDMTAREKADGLIGTSDDESSADTIYGAKAYAKEQFERIISLDGMIIPTFESGGMSLTDGVLDYAPNSKKIRTKQGVLYKVKAGSKVWLTDYTGLSLTIYYTYDETKFTSRSVSEGEFVFDADCSVAISINSDATQTDLSNAEKIVVINADNVLQRVLTLEDQNGFIIDEGFGYTTNTGVIVGKTQSELNSIKTKVQSGEKYSITALATNYYRPYATTDKNLNIIRLCETTSFSGELIIEDGEEYLITNFKPLYENKFYLNVPGTLSIVKEVHDRDFGTLVSKDIFPVATRTTTSNGVTYTPDENGALYATGSATSSSYYTIFNNGFPEHFYAGETYYIDYYSFNPNIHIQIRWVDADGTYTYLHDKYFGGYFTIPKEAVGIQIRWYIGASVVGLNNYSLNARIYSVESVNFAKLKKERTQYRPMLTIIYDDSHKEFYEYILPIIQEKNVPIATAVISKSVNENDETKMTWTQIEECFLRGTEVLDHTYAHIAPATRETMTVEELEREYLMGRHLLQLKGFNPPCALIFNGYTARLENCRKAASRVYKAGFNASSGGINFHSQFDPYNINRYGTDGQTLDTLKGWIDELVAAKTGWMVWTRHNSNAATENPVEAAEILSSAIDYALEYGIDIVTVERGLYEYLDI